VDYFLRQGWTGIRERRPTGKSLGGRERESDGRVALSRFVGAEQIYQWRGSVDGWFMNRRAA
jgi:hypothetical protein